MRVLVGMSGGVDSSVAAALLVEAGHDVVGATMKLWGGPSDSGCCSVGDTDDAARVAAQLGVAHHVFNFTDAFLRHVVDPYVEAHATGRTPNPCVACNEHLKFDLFLARARQLGFDAVATGHYARVERAADGWVLRRGVDPAKDQSYVLHALGQEQLARTLLPLGGLTKPEVRARAAALGLRTAAKPDSQDVCFISRAGGREAFLGSRIPLRPGRLTDRAGTDLGPVDAVELVTVGQRRGLGNLAAPATRSQRRYALDVDVVAAVVTVGTLDELLVGTVTVDGLRWCGDAPEEGRRVQAQLSAHGAPVDAELAAGGVLHLAAPVRRVAPGQRVVVYDGDVVLGGGTAA
ncbi:MAG TPA: tRNA 2-thiouridine(34) synthase MnmA [Acidimicrobiales bacterium]|nr:tRNA 2-thiouridine(34) synthase MnmA [Acidimicrobiales bacterium]